MLTKKSSTKRTQEFVEAFSAVAPKLSPTDYAILRAHYHAPRHRISATDLARAVGFANHSASNLRYGKLASRLWPHFGGILRGQRLILLVGFIAPGEDHNEHWLWEMDSAVAHALEQLGWVGADEAVVPSPEAETPPDRIPTQVNRIIRDTAATKSLKSRYRFRCQVCGIQIEATRGRYYIEVHHIRPLGGEHRGLDQHSNMLVLCPNHHAMFDLGMPRFETEKRITIHGEAFDLDTKHSLSRTAISYYNAWRDNRYA